MSHHHKFEIHVKTSGELDTEDNDVELLAAVLLAEARKYCRPLDMDVTVTEVERT